MINDGLKAQFCLLCNKKAHFLTDGKRRGRILNPTINACRACWPTLVIKVDLHDCEAASFQRVLLLAKGDEEVFAESPVYESAQMIHLANLQPSDFSNGDFRALIRYVLCVIVVNRRYLRKRQCALVMRWA